MTEDFESSPGGIVYQRHYQFDDPEALSERHVRCAVRRFRKSMEQRPDDENLKKTLSGWEKLLAKHVAKRTGTVQPSTQE